MGNEADEDKGWTLQGVCLLHTAPGCIARARRGMRAHHQATAIVADGWAKKPGGQLFNRDKRLKVGKLVP